MPRPIPQRYLQSYATAKKALAQKPPKLVLSEADLRFVDEYLIDADVEAAAKRAGFPEYAASKLWSRKEIRASVQIQQRRRNERVEVQQDYVLRRWLQVLEADPRELSEHWRVACRHCWGHDHRYQWSDHELREAQLKHELQQRRIKSEEDRVEFDDLGGDGYTILKDPMRGEDWVEFVLRRNIPIPDPEANAPHTCPACWGFGIPHIMFHDTRTLSPAAALLYKGVKVTPGGYEIMTRDQEPTEQLVARHQGYFVERKLVLIADAAKMNELELEAAIEDELRERDRLRALGTGGAVFPDQDGERADPAEAGSDGG